MSSYFRFKKYLCYQWQAKSKYYLHSPFAYQFYMQVLSPAGSSSLAPVTRLRKQLSKDNHTLRISDFGTGNISSRTISSIERNVAVRKKYGTLLYHLVRYFKSQYILEIGTSIGLSSSYLALANPEAKIISLEGAEELIDMAHKNHAQLHINNVEIMPGNFNDTLSAAIQKLPRLDVVLFDGNHTREATLRYFHECLKNAHEHSVFIFDDIYWSEDMNEAWEQIKANEKVTITIDVYQYGICFFTKEKLAKENFVLRY